MSEGRARQLVNLRSWKPGESGNPNGRPRKKPITLAAEKLLTQKVPLEVSRNVPWLKGKRKTWAEAIVAGQAIQGVKGKTEAAVFVAGYGEGKPAAEEQQGGERITIQIVRELSRGEWEERHREQYALAALVGDPEEAR